MEEKDIKEMQEKVLSVIGCISGKEGKIQLACIVSLVGTWIIAAYGKKNHHTIIDIVAEAVSDLKKAPTFKEVDTDA